MKKFIISSDVQLVKSNKYDEDYYITVVWGESKFGELKKTEVRYGECNNIWYKLPECIRCDDYTEGILIDLADTYAAKVYFIKKGQLLSANEAVVKDVVE